MNQYRVGTVAATNGSAVIVGTGTTWAAYVTAGSVFTVAGSMVPYVVASVTDNTHLTLSSNYGGTTASGLSYTIGTSFTPNYSLPYIEQGDVETATIIKRSTLMIDGLLAASVPAAAGSASAAAASELAAAAAETAAANSASSASVSASDAAAAWTAAIASTPDLNPAIRMNPSTITSDLTIPAGYNAYSAGPLEIADGVTVTLNDNSTWSII